MKKTSILRGYTLDWYSDDELLMMFPEVKELLPIKILDLEKIIQEEKNEIAGILNKINESETDNFSKWFSREIVKMELVSELRKHDRELFNLKKYIRMLNPSTKYISNFQEKLEIAKSYPIYEIAKQYLELKQCGNKFAGLCPFHNEKTPSFFIYTESNTYYCFGCGTHGDVINLTMELYGVDFKNAVEILQR